MKKEYFLRIQIKNPKCFARESIWKFHFLTAFKFKHKMNSIFRFWSDMVNMYIFMNINKIIVIINNNNNNYICNNNYI